MVDTRGEQAFRTIEGAADCALCRLREVASFGAAVGQRVDGPGEYLYLCLVMFAPTTRTTIILPETPTRLRPRSADRGGSASGWCNRRSPGPAWSEFIDPLDAISARFRPGMTRERPDRFTATERAALGVMDLTDEADRTALRRRYSELVRRYHPDRNGGDRGFEGKLGAVIEAYQMLKGSRAFAA